MATLVIVVAGAVPGDRLRWSVAHELGHLVVHQSPDGTLTQFEQQANQFAAEFLLPEVAMRHELVPPITLSVIVALKPRWQVSMQALIRRAHDLRILSDRQYHYLFEQLGARGWRTQEPANLDIPVEKPRAIRQLAETLYKYPLPDQIVAETLFAEDDVVELLAGFAEAKRREHTATPIVIPVQVPIIRAQTPSCHSSGVGRFGFAFRLPRHVPARTFAFRTHMQRLWLSPAILVLTAGACVKGAAGSGEDPRNDKHYLRNLDAYPGPSAYEMIDFVRPVSSTFLHAAPIQ